jgi:outer membrane immunogenic protein
MKRILLAGVAALALGGTAFAADLAVKAPVAYVPLFTWTGCYLGANGGWIGGRDGYRTEPKNQDITAVDRGLVTREWRANKSAGTAGGQFGCQVQLGSWVIGGEWDWNWAGLAEDSTWSTPLIPLIDMTEDQWGPRDYWTHKELDWFSTARVRLGLAWDRVLVFATGGLAYGAFDAYTHVRRYPDGFYNGAYSERRFGWTVGGGLEWAFANNWTAKAEFLYLNFDNFDYISPGNIDIAPQYQWRTKIDAEEYVARIGINYLFHTGGAVARY